jgi:molybdate transport system substrate-binding protein
MRLLERWGVAGELASRLVQAPAGVPVAALLAQGRVELGFQQLSELIGIDGVDVLGTLPPGADFVTTFSAARHSGTGQLAAVSDFLEFLQSDACREAKIHRGMAPAG